MHKLALILFTIVFSFSAFAEEEAVLTRGKDKTSLDLERVVLEDNIKSKILGAIVPIIPNIRFNLSVNINYKIENKKKQEIRDENGQYVELGKLGVVAPSVSDQVMVKNLISQIGYIKITFIFYDEVEQAKLQVIQSIIKKVVDVVPVWRLRIETVLPPPKAKSTLSVENIKQNPAPTIWFILGGLAIAIIGYGLFRVHQDLNALRMTLSEFRQQKWRKKEPKPKAETKYYQTHYSEAAPEPEPEPVNVHPMRDVVPVASVNQTSEQLNLSDPETEEQIFEDLARAGKFEELQIAATSHFPSSLILDLPPSFLSGALSYLSVHQATTLVLSQDSDRREVLMNCMNEKMKYYLEHELENCERDPVARMTIEKNGAQYWKEFVQLVRELIRSHEHFAVQAQPVLERWLKAQRERHRHAG